MARVTVEDCLELVPNRFSMALLGSQRARQILRGSKTLVEAQNKPCVMALREIAAGRVHWDYAVEDVLRGDVPEDILRRRNRRNS